MFPMFGLMNSGQQPGMCRPRRTHCQCNPQYNPLNMPTQYFPFDGRFIQSSDAEYPENYEQWINDIFPGVGDLLQTIVDAKNKNADQDRKREQNNKDDKPDNKTKYEDGKKTGQKMNSTEENTQHTTSADKPKKKTKRNVCQMNSTEKNLQCTILKDIFNHALSAYKNVEPTTNAKWETKIDCRGFLSANIKVKIDENQLLIRAFRKQESKDGLRTITLSKSVNLPENIDPRQITCKLGPTGFMLIQAPYMETKRVNTKKLVAGLINQIVPGLAAFVNDLEAKEETSSAEQNENKKGSHENCRDMTVDKHEEHKEEEKKNEKTDAEQKVDVLNLDTIESNEEEQKVGSKNHDLEIGTDNIDMDKSVEVDGSLNCDFTVDEGHMEDQNQDVSMIEVDLPDDQHSKDLDTTTDIKALELLPDDRNSHNVSNTHDDSSATSEDSFVRLSEFDNESYKEASIDSTTADELNQASVSNNDSETENVVVRLEMPCYNPQSLRVSFDEGNRTLNITASKGEAGSKSFSTINKSITIQDDVDTNRLHCFFKDGALNVTAPHKDKSLIQDIPISF